MTTQCPHRFHGKRLAALGLSRVSDIMPQGHHSGQVGGLSLLVARAFKGISTSSKDATRLEAYCD